MQGGESGDLQGSLTGGREAAPGCRGRSTSPFQGLYPHTRCLVGYLSSCLSVHYPPPNQHPRPTTSCGPLLGSPGAVRPCVPSKHQSRGAGWEGGASGQGPAGWRGGDPSPGPEGRRTLPPDLPSPTPLQLFKASGGRGKLLQMCGFVFFSTGTGRLLSRSGDSS